MALIDYQPRPRVPWKPIPVNGRRISKKDVRRLVDAGWTVSFGYMGIWKGLIAHSRETANAK